MRLKAVTGIALTVLLTGMLTLAFVSNPVNACVSGMISYWRFDEGSGTIAYDSVDANHGTISGAVWTTGKVDDALSFDGNDYVDAGNDASLSISGSITVAAWVYPTQYNLGRIVSKGAYVHPYTYMLHFGEADERYFKFRIGQTLVRSSPVDLNQWYFVVGTYDGTVSIYLNGVLNHSLYRGGPIPTNSVPLYIGRDPPPNTYYFSGIIDEVAVYDRALTPTEIQQHYEYGLMGQGYCEAPPPPVGGIWVPIDKFGLLAPYIGLASTIVIATAATAIYVKRVKHRNKK